MSLYLEAVQSILCIQGEDLVSFSLCLFVHVFPLYICYAHLHDSFISTILSIQYSTSKDFGCEIGFLSSFCFIIFYFASGCKISVYCLSLMCSGLLLSPVYVHVLVSLGLYWEVIWKSTSYCVERFCQILDYIQRENKS